MVGSYWYDDQWNSIKDVAISLKHPQSGYGSILSYLEAIVEQVICEIPSPNLVHFVRSNFQSTKDGETYIISGGLGRFRSIYLAFSSYWTALWLQLNQNHFRSGWIFRNSFNKWFEFQQ